MTIHGPAITIGEYRKKFEISQGLCGLPRTDLENLPETPNNSRRHSGPTFLYRLLKNGIERNSHS